MCPWYPSRAWEVDLTAEGNCSSVDSVKDDLEKLGMQGSKAIETIRWHAGKLELLVGGLSLAFAMVLASLFARRRGTAQDLALLTRVAGAMATGSAALVRFRGNRRVSKTS